LPSAGRARLRRGEWRGDRQSWLTELQITVSDGPGAEPTRWTLICDPPGGTHPDPGGACRAIGDADDPFAPVPADMMCTQVYGGPETAEITGTWRGERVAATYRRTDGCEIARWGALAAVLAPRT
jgi:hypothetical protein